MIRVLFTQTQIKRYRVPFFTKLHAALLPGGIEIKVAYSDPPKTDKPKRDNVDLPPEIGIKVPGYWLFGNHLFYQALLQRAMAADLVIAEQANKNIHNYVLLLSRMVRHKRLAFWGLGKNNDLDHSPLSEWLRPHIARRVDWWFTYTKGTAGWLTANGVAPEKIIVIQNSTDTLGFAEQIASIPEERLKQARQQLGIAPGCRVGIYCGILAPDKGIAFLLEAARLVRERLPNFHLLVLGGGSESEKVQQAVLQVPWIHYMGPKFGEEKALLLKMSDCFLLPGRVGLAILDAFAAGVPLITTKVPFHGPEVEYLEDGINGRITENNVESYANSIVEILSDSNLSERLKRGASESAKRYSIEAMVETCRRGITHCLSFEVRASGALVNGPKSTQACSESERGSCTK